MATPPDLPEGRLNPFPGIRPYQPDESELFFGRGDHIHELLRVLRRNRFVAVLGNSGTGKSSLVRAGVLPPLDDGFLVPEPGLWRMAIMRPGKADPIGALATAISGTAENGWGLERSRDDVLRSLRRGGLGLVDVARSAPLRPGSRFLVLVDQFEELFGFMSTPGDFEASDEARAFVRLLLEATTRADPTIYVIITMRSEFIGHTAAVPGLSEVINRSLYLVPELDRDQLREVIEGPLRLRGARVEPSLVNRILNDAGRTHDKLPVLGHALSGLWKAWRARLEREGTWDRDPSERPPLAAEDYDRIGGVESSLREHLERLYGRLTPRQKEIAEQLFRYLATTRPDGTAVRRPTRLDVIARTSGASLDDVRAVIDVFRSKGRSFLTPPYGTDIQAEDDIDIAHEAMFRRWPRFAKWMEEDSADGHLLGELKKDAAAWRGGDRDKALLYTGARLMAAEQWQAERAPRTTALEGRGLESEPVVQDFLRAGVAEREALRVRQRRVWVGGGVITAGTLVLASSFLGSLDEKRELQEALGVSQTARDSAEAQTKMALEYSELADAEARRARAAQVQISALLDSVSAERATVAAQNRLLEAQQDSMLSRQLAATASLAPEGDPDLGILLALEAVAIAETREAMGALHRGVQSSPFRLRIDVPTPAMPLPGDDVGGAGSPVQVRFSTDGLRVAAVVDDGSARLWGAATGAYLGDFASEDELSALAFHPDGIHLVTGSIEGATTLWDGWTREPVRVLARDRTVYAVAFSEPDGRRVSLGLENGTVLIVDVQSGDSVGAVLAHDGSVSRVAYSADGGLLATAGEDGIAKLWPVSSGVPTDSIPAEVLEGHRDLILGLAFHPSRPLVATGSWDRTVIVWDTDSGDEVVRLTGHESDVNAVDFSPDGSLLVTTSDDGRALLWDWERRRLALELTGHEDWVLSAAFSPDGRRIATGSGDGTVRVWSTSLDEEMLSLQAHQDAVSSLVSDTAVGRLVSASHDGTLGVWDARTGELVFERTGGPPLEAVAVSPTGEMLATAGRSGVATIRSASTGDVIHALTGHRGDVEDISFDASGARVVTASADGSAKVWDVRSGRLVLDLVSAEGVADTKTGQATRRGGGEGGERGGGAMQAARFSPDGSLIATGSKGGSLRVWDASNGAGRSVGETGPGGITSLRFSPDGSLLATANEDYTVRLWRVGTWERTATLVGHTNVVEDISFSPEGDRLASASMDGTVRIWDVTTGRELRAVGGYSGGVEAVTFSPDGSAVVIGAQDGRVHVLAENPDALRRLARARVSRALGPSECARYLGDAGCSGEAIQWLIRAREAAWRGDREQADGHYRQALQIDADLGIDPAAEAGRLVGASLEAQARYLAAAGDEAGATRLFLEARRTSPDSATFEIQEEIQRIRVDRLASEVAWLTRAGDFDNARNKATGELADLDPASADERIAAIHRAEAQALIDAGDAFALQGSLEEASKQYEQAASIYSGVAPSDNRADSLYRAETRRSAQEGFERASALVRQGRISQAKQAFDDAHALDPEAGFALRGAVLLAGSAPPQFRIGSVERALEALGASDALSDGEAATAVQLNQACWWGTLWGHAAEVLEYCGRAVALAEEPDNADHRFLNNIRDSRGVALAVLGEFRRAIEDLRAYAEDESQNEAQRRRRTEWIAQLQNGVNPLTDEVLAQLRG